MDEKQFIEKILSVIGKEVSFNYPEDDLDKKGKLKDRAVIPSSFESDLVSYYDVVDLIEFPSHPETKWIRIGYYRTPKGKLVWGSQTTITEPIKQWKKMLVHAAREKKWFRELLEDVMRELT